MEKPPAAMIVVDVKYEDIAVAEARRCEIPVAALVDTNSDPTVVDYPIPSNDDAVKSIRIILEVLVEAIQSGLSQRQAKQENAGVQAPAANAAREMVADAPQAEEEAADQAQEAAEEPEAEAPAPVPEPQAQPEAVAEPEAAETVEEPEAEVPEAVEEPVEDEEKAAEPEPLKEEASEEAPEEPKEEDKKDS